MHASYRLLGVLVMGLLAGACGARAPATATADARSDPRGQPYAIGPSDVIRITVWKNPELSTEAVVRPDGTVTMPVVGELRAAGRTAADLQADATTRTRALVNDAVVTVAIVEVNSYRFTVAGNVEHPGLFTSRYYVSVSDAIALAGGPNRYASTSDVTVVRTGAQGTERIRVDYDGILSGKHPEQDIVLHAGDAVRVP